MFTLNIGLNRPDGGTNTVERVMDAVRRTYPTDTGIHAPLTFHGPINSNTEPTMVVEVGAAGWNTVEASLVHRLSETLGQEAIAVYWNRSGKGYLVGPQAEKWGEFNPQFFLMPDGRTLNAHLQPVNQG